MLSHVTDGTHPRATAARNPTATILSSTRPLTCPSSSGRCCACCVLRDPPRFSRVKTTTSSSSSSTTAHAMLTSLTRSALAPHLNPAPPPPHHHRHPPRPLLPTVGSEWPAGTSDGPSVCRASPPQPPAAPRHPTRHARKSISKRTRQPAIVARRISLAAPLQSFTHAHARTQPARRAQHGHDGRASTMDTPRPTGGGADEAASWGLL